MYYIILICNGQINSVNNILVDHTFSLIDDKDVKEVSIHESNVLEFW